MCIKHSSVMMNKCLINYNVKDIKSENSHNYGSLIEHGPHSLINILIFISEKYFDICIRF